MWKLPCREGPKCYHICLTALVTGTLLREYGNSRDRSRGIHIYMSILHMHSVITPYKSLSGTNCKTGKFVFYLVTHRLKWCTRRVLTVLNTDIAMPAVPIFIQEFPMGFYQDISHVKSMNNVPFFSSVTDDGTPQEPAEELRPAYPAIRFPSQQNRQYTCHHTQQCYVLCSTPRIDMYCMVTIVTY